jgi:hypothetical protein
MWDEVAKGARQKYTNPSICQAKRLIGGVIRSKKGMPAPNSVFNTTGNQVLHNDLVLMDLVEIRSKLQSFY